MSVISKNIVYNFDMTITVKTYKETVTKKKNLDHSLLELAV